MKTLKIKIVNTAGVFSTQHLEIAHNFEKAEKIPVEKETIITVDYEKYKDGIVWDDFIDLNIELRNKLKELSYYSKIQLALNRIVERLSRLDYTKRFEIQSLANDAYKIIGSTEEPNSLTNNMFRKNIIVDDLKHTLNKEVDALMSHKASSQRAKNDLVNDAVKYLKSDIQSFIIR